MYLISFTYILYVSFGRFNGIASKPLSLQDRYWPMGTLDEEQEQSTGQLFVATDIRVITIKKRIIILGILIYNVK